MRVLRSECGQALVELTIAMSVLAVAITALLGLLVSTALSLQRSSVRGTALTLADKRLELYRTLAYQNIRLDPTALGTINTASPALPYKMAHAVDPSIPASTSEVVCSGTDPDGNTEVSCASPGPTEVQPRLTGQIGPDKRSYEIDTYIAYVAAGTTGRTSKQVMVVVRSEWNGLPIVARASSSFDKSNLATG